MYLNKLSAELHFEYHAQPWLREVETYLAGRYYAIEKRVVETSRFVELNSKNAGVFSTEYASILRDVGSAFASTMDKLVRLTGFAVKDETTIADYRSFLIKQVPGVHKLQLKLASVHEEMYLQPFKEFESGSNPLWWQAINDLKHNEMDSYEKGNMTNCLNGVAALAVLRKLLDESGGEVTLDLFTEVGYPQKGLSEIFGESS